MAGKGAHQILDFFTFLERTWGGLASNAIRYFCIDEVSRHELIGAVLFESLVQFFPLLALLSTLLVELLLEAVQSHE